MSESVNFWKYAINEKCQDALICYLLNFEETRNKFFECCGIKGDILIEEDQNSEKSPIKLQHKKIDILVETNNNYIIIEDKIDSTEHDNQLKKYVGAVKEENKEGKVIHVCYVKSGYLSRQEKRNITKSLSEIDFSMRNLHFIDLSELLEIVKLAKSNTIITQWIAKYEKELENQNNIIDDIKRDINQKNYKSLYVKVFKNEKDYLQPYLDILTEKIRECSSFKQEDVEWQIAGYGTAHIQFKQKEIPMDKGITSYNFYLMCRKNNPELVLKQHFYDVFEDNNFENKDRIKISGYSEAKVNILKKNIENIDKKIKTLNSNLDSNEKNLWKKINIKDKGRLMLCQKQLNPADNLIDVLEKQEKNNIEEIFSILN
ncbi:MAG: PD-(D/E)XK nuclease family protein [Alphaproteobacteria bacterium]|nr:PD-(D/E)XK nuclease family protein [Alphaproteobacteria bacterium]